MNGITQNLTGDSNYLKRELGLDWPDAVFDYGDYPAFDFGGVTLDREVHEYIELLEGTDAQADTGEAFRFVQAYAREGRAVPYSLLLAANLTIESSGDTDRDDWVLLEMYRDRRAPGDDTPTLNMAAERSLTGVEWLHAVIDREELSGIGSYVVEFSLIDNDEPPEDWSDDYTQPKLRLKLYKEIYRGDKGGRSNQWSARKAQLLAQRYEDEGGGYKGGKSESQKNLSDWTSEEWTTESGEEAGSSKTGKYMDRYLPKPVWDEMSDSEKETAKRTKRKGEAEGRSNVSWPEPVRKAIKRAKDKGNLREDFSNSRLEVIEFVSSKALPGLDRSPKKNWVDRVGGLPDYIEAIAKHLHYEAGRPIGMSIAIAINAVKKMCATGDLNFRGIQQVKGITRAKACKAVAEWEAKKKAAKALSRSKSYTPTKKMKQEAARGLRLRDKFGRGGKEPGVRRAKQLVSGEDLDEDDIKDMYGWFARHVVDAGAKGSKSGGFWGDDNNPSNGWIAWLLWGGNDGRDWVIRQRESMDDADDLSRVLTYIELIRGGFNPNQPRWPDSAPGGKGGQFMDVDAPAAPKITYQSFPAGKGGAFLKHESNKWVKTLSDEEIGGVADYMQSSHSSINSVLRKGSALSEYDAATVELLDSALDKASVPRNLVVNRIMNDPKLRKLVAEDKAEGEIYTDKAYTSTSLNTSVFDSLMTSVGDKHQRVEVRVPKGAKGAFLDGVPGNTRNELELLLARGTRFRILEGYEDEDGGVQHIIMEVLGEDAELARKGFNPKQVRWPEGTSKGGQWMKMPSIDAPDAPSTDLGDAMHFENTPLKSFSALDGWPEKTDLASKVLGSDFDTTEAKYKTGEGDYDYTPSRLALHQQIINDALQGVEATENPQALFTAGGSGSGKSSLLNSNPELFPGGYEEVKDGRGATRNVPSNAVYVDPDRIKEALPEYQILSGAHDPYAAMAVHGESGDIASKLTQEAADRGYNVVIDGTGNSQPGQFAERFKVFDEYGYETSVVYATIPTSQALYRNIVRSQQERRFVPPSEVKRIHANVSRNFDEIAKLPFIKDLRVYDTTGNPRLIAQGANGNLEIIEQELFDAFIGKGDEGD